MPRKKQSPPADLPPTSEVWRSRRYRGGVFNRRGWCWYRFNGKSLSPGERFDAEHKAEIVEHFEQWVRSLKNPTRQATVSHAHTFVQSGDTPDLFSAVDQFKAARYSSMSLSVQSAYNRATSYFLRNHLPLNHAALVADLIERNNQAADERHPDHLAQNTRRKYLDYLYLFYEWTIERGWLAENPVAAVGKPKKKKKTDVFVFSRAEITAICDDLRKQPGQEDVALLIELLAVSGLRISEALGLRWMDILPTGLRVLSAKGARPRTISLALIPGLDDVLKRLKKQMDRYAKRPPGERRRHSRPEYIFWWTDPTKPRQFFNAAKARLELDWGGRTLHTLRGSAEYWWEFELGLDERTICDIAGHSAGTRHEYYRVTPTTADLEEKDRRRREQQKER